MASKRLVVWLDASTASGPKRALSTGPGWCQLPKLALEYEKKLTENARLASRMRTIVAGFKNGDAPSVAIAMPVSPRSAERPPVGVAR
jgi:hypothetical protein